MGRAGVKALNVQHTCPASEEPTTCAMLKTRQLWKNARGFIMLDQRSALFPLQPDLVKNCGSIKLYVLSHHFRGESISPWEKTRALLGLGRNFQAQKVAHPHKGGAALAFPFCLTRCKSNHVINGEGLPKTWGKAKFGESQSRRHPPVNLKWPWRGSRVSADVIEVAH